MGPAALNLQLLRKRGVSATLAGATVALVQVSQFIVTVAILVMLAIVSGDSGALRDLPSAAVLWALGLVAVLVAALLLIGTAIPLGAFFGLAVGLLAQGDHMREDEGVGA